MGILGIVGADPFKPNMFCYYGVEEMTAHTINVTITPLCTACGKELQTGGTESRATNHPFERDNAWERKDQRVFVYA